MATDASLFSSVIVTTKCNFTGPNRIVVLSKHLMAEPLLDPLLASDLLTVGIARLAFLTVG